MVTRNATGAIGVLIVGDGQPQSGDTQTARHLGWETVSPDPARAHVLPRRWAAAVCAVTAAAGMFIAWRIDEQAQPCQTVRALIDFNRTTQASLKAKTHFAPAGSYEGESVPTDADYQAWIEGMQQHANQVTAPGLAAHAHQAAELARQFMRDMNWANVEMGKQDPLKADLPPPAKVAARINREFDDEMGALEHACPG